MQEIQTGVDELMQLLREHHKISIKEAAQKLQTPETTIQAWVDFLVEDHILGIEYKFTTPYVYIHNEERVEELQEENEDNYALNDYRNGFYQKAQEKQLPEENIEKLWKEHLLYVVREQQQHFLRECQKRGVPQAQELFEEYIEEVREHAS